MCVSHVFLYKIIIIKWLAMAPCALECAVLTIPFVQSTSTANQSLDPLGAPGGANVYKLAADPITRRTTSRHTNGGG